MVFICVTDTRPGNNIQLFCNCVTTKKTNDPQFPCTSATPACSTAGIHSQRHCASACVRPISCYTTDAEFYVRYVRIYFCHSRAKDRITRQACRSRGGGVLLRPLHWWLPAAALQLTRFSRSGRPTGVSRFRCGVDFSEGALLKRGGRYQRDDLEILKEKQTNKHLFMRF